MPAQSIQNRQGFQKFGVGIDVHKQFSIVHVYSLKTETGMEYIYDKTDRFEMTPQGLSELVTYLSKVPNPVVAFESTGPYSLLVYKFLQKILPLEKIFCVNAFFVKALPGRKSDKIDAKNLAKYAFHGLLRGSYIPDDTYQILRRLTRGRKRGARMIVNAKNRLIMILDRAGLRINQAIGLFAKYGLHLLLDLAQGISLKQHVENAPPNSHILRYKPDLSPFFSIELLESEREELQAALMEYFFLVKQETEYERSLYNYIAKPGNKSLLTHFNILKSIPGIGDISAFELLAELGPITRFASLKKVQSYAGLVPTLVESGGKEKKEKLQKRGNKRLRTTLIQCARALSRSQSLSPQFRAYISRVVRRNTIANREILHKKVWVELAKKLLRICIALLRSGRSFDSLVIEKSQKEKVEKELTKRKKELTYFKKQITKLRRQFKFSFATLKAMVDEVAKYGESHVGP